MASKTIVPNWAKLTAVIVLFVTAVGVAIGIFGGGFLALWKMGRSSHWSWWQYALAVPVLGALALGAEAVGEFVIAPFIAWRRNDQPIWKRVAFVSCTLAFIVAGLVWVFEYQQ
jgi:hypothetical protein